jgi:hypothetical protein
LDVLEHLPDFERQLIETHKALKANGLVVIRVPNMVFHLAKLAVLRTLDLRWKYGLFTPPDHLNHFRPKVLSALLQRLGFRVLKTTDGYPAMHGGWVRVVPLLGLFVGARVLDTVSAGRLVVGNSLVIVGEKSKSNLSRTS